MTKNSKKNNLCQEFNFYEVVIPFRAAFEHASYRRERTHGILVEVRFADGSCGWGECHPRPYVGSETLESAWEWYTQILPKLPLVSTLKPVSSTDFCEILAKNFDIANSSGNLAAWTGIELALLDAYSKSTGRSCKEIVFSDSSMRRSSSQKSVGGKPHQLHTPQVTLPLGLVNRSNLWTLNMKLYAANKMKLPIKFKINRESALTVIKHLNGKLQDDGLEQIPLIVFDANGSLDPNLAQTFVESSLKLNFPHNSRIVFEQLTPRGTEEHWGHLMSIIKTHEKNAKSTRQPQLGTVSYYLMADESYCTKQDLDFLLENALCNAVNFRHGKNGGFSAWNHLLRTLEAYPEVKIHVGTLVGELGPSIAASGLLAILESDLAKDDTFPELLLRRNVFPDYQLSYQRAAFMYRHSLQRQTQTHTTGLTASPDQRYLEEVTKRTFRLSL